MSTKTALATASSNETFEFTDRDFAGLIELVADFTGIALTEQKRSLVYGRLAKRLRANGLTRFSDYRILLEDKDSPEREQFTNAITTNLTAFFREKHHFDYLTEELIPDILKHRKRDKIRIWSAGCSTGEEPYSIAMALRESVPNIDSLDMKILATDLDTNVVETGRNGVYTVERVKDLDPARKKRWFQRGTGDQQGKVRVSPDLRKMVSFRQLNLMQKWPLQSSFDVIFCRNVVIYFDKPTQHKLYNRFASLIPAQGTLFIGHSETLHGVDDDFELIGKTIYRKRR